jgi:hypothetical protein
MSLPRHPRSLVRDLVYLIIKNDVKLNTFFLNEDGVLNVSKNRDTKYFEQDLPAVSVYTLDTKDDDQDTAPKVFKRDFTVEVQLMAKNVDLVDEFLDSAARQIEYILLRWEGLILDPIKKERIKFINNFTMTGTQQGLFAQGDDVYSGMNMQFSAEIYDDDITGGQNEDFSTPAFTLENNLIDLHSINAALTTTENAAVEINVDLT